MKDLAICPGSVLCVQRVMPNFVSQLNALPPPEGFVQRSFVLHRESLLVAARAILAMAVDG
eukprot:6448238-Lingulodinium_polyedra.AAC.1